MIRCLYPLLHCPELNSPLGKINTTCLCHLVCSYIFSCPNLYFSLTQRLTDKLSLCSIFTSAMVEMVVYVNENIKLMGKLLKISEDSNTFCMQFTIQHDLKPGSQAVLQDLKNLDGS